MSDKITLEQWLAELGRVSQSNDGATVKEIMAATGMAKPAVMARLHALDEEGRLISGRRVITSIDRRRRHVPTYKIVPAKRKAK